MNHHLEVNLTPRKPSIPLLEWRTYRIGQWLFRRLFGRRRVIILFPAESVDGVTIIEQPSGGQAS